MAICAAKELIEPKNYSLPVEWQNDLEPPTKAQVQKAEEEQKEK